MNDGVSILVNGVALCLSLGFGLSAYKSKRFWLAGYFLGVVIMNLMLVAHALFVQNGG